MESAKSRQLDMEQLQQAYPARTMTRTYSLIQRMQDKAAELEQQSEIASAGTLHASGSTGAQDVLKSTSLARQPTRAPRSFMFSNTDTAADTKEDSASGPALALSVTQLTSNTLRPNTPKLTKHQTMTMTSVSRSTGRSDKARRAQEQHEQDMLEELDRMHEECAALHDDAQRHQESYMRRELRWEATVARLQQQVAQLKGEGSHKAAEDAAEGQAKQLSSIRELHKEVVVGIDEAMARHAKETDKVDLLTLKQLKGRVNVLEQQIVQDKARQLTEEEVYDQRTAGLRQELEAMRAAASQFDRLHREAAAEVERLKEAQGLEQGQAHTLLKQGAALKRDNHLLKEDLAAAEAELAGWYETMQRETHALKRIYHQVAARDSSPVPLEAQVSEAGVDHAKGKSPSGAGPVDAEGPAEGPVPEWLTRDKQKMTDAQKADKIAARQLPQMALLRERLAKEQQRARAAEATLAAQQQVQQLLQSAVQAVLLARISAQEAEEESQAASSNGRAVMRTAISIPCKAQGNSPSSRPLSAASVPRISLSLGGIRSELGSAPRPHPAPVSAFPGTTAQTDCPEGINQRGDIVDLARPAVEMQPTAASNCNVLQQEELKPIEPAAVQRQGFKGSKQRPQSAQPLAHRPLSGNSRPGKRPQSAVTPTTQPPFWTGSMQEVELSYQVDDCWRQPEQHHQGVLQQPQAGLDAARGLGHGTILQRPQSASSVRSSHSAGAESTQPGHRGVGNMAAAGNQALRTVPEDDATALQPGQFRQTALPEGRAGSLRAWRGMYTQASASRAALDSQQGQTLHSNLRPTSAAKQHTSLRPSSAHTSSSASRPTSASGSRGSRRQDLQQQRQQKYTSSAVGQNEGREMDCTLSGALQARGRSRGRGTLLRQGDSSNMTGYEGQEKADLTGAERRQVAETLLSLPEFASLVNSQVCSSEQKPAWPVMLPLSVPRPVSPSHQAPEAVTGASEAKPWRVTAAQTQADFLAGKKPL